MTTWTELFSVTPYAHQSVTLNSAVYQIPDNATALRFSVALGEQNFSDMHGQLLYQISNYASGPFMPVARFSWELTNKIGKIDKFGNTIQQNVGPSFEYSLPAEHGGKYLQGTLSLSDPGNIGFVVEWA